MPIKTKRNIVLLGIALLLLLPTAGYVAAQLEDPDGCPCVDPAPDTPKPVFAGDAIQVVNTALANAGERMEGQSQHLEDETEASETASQTASQISRAMHDMAMQIIGNIRA